MPEREFETGKDEAWSNAMLTDKGILFSNQKRTYDEYQDVSLDRKTENQRQKQLSYDRAQSHYDDVQSLFKQHMQNSVENANIAAKQLLRAGELAIDRQWNVNETDNLTAKSGIQSDAIIAAVVKAVTQALRDVEE